MQIRLTIGDQHAIATLADTPTARDFASLLPLTLTLENYANIERIAYLPRKLSREAAPAGTTPQAGDLTYYAPWGNLAIFLDGFRYSPGLLPLGKIDSGFAVLQNAAPPFIVHMELIND